MAKKASSFEGILAEFERVFDKDSTQAKHFVQYLSDDELAVIFRAQKHESRVDQCLSILMGEVLYHRHLQSVAVMEESKRTLASIAERTNVRKTG